MFRDRSEAGILLAVRLRKYRDEPGIVLAIPRGGVPVAYEVAAELGFPLELALTKKIGHPFNKEYAIGAASLSDYFVIPHEGVTNEYIQTELQRLRNRLREMQEKFMRNKKPTDLKNKTIIVVDDGIATGNTLMGTIRVIRKFKPAKIIVAVPVASESAVEKLSNEADELIVLYTPENFLGVGAFYENFEQVSDDEVVSYLNKLEELKKEVL